jgi:hypothetical protein
VSTGLNLLTGCDAGVLEHHERDHIPRGRSRIGVAPLEAFQVIDAVDVAVARHEDLGPVLVIAEPDRFVRDVYAAQLAGEGVAESGDEAHRVRRRGAHLLDGGGVGGRNADDEFEAGSLFQRVGHDLAAGRDDVGFDRRDEQHLDRMLGASDVGHGLRGRLRRGFGGGGGLLRGLRGRRGAGAEGDGHDDEQAHRKEGVSLTHWSSFLLWKVNERGETTANGRTCSVITSSPVRGMPGMITCFGRVRKRDANRWQATAPRGAFASQHASCTAPIGTLLAAAARAD